MVNRQSDTGNGECLAEDLLCLGLAYWIVQPA